ncbi:hypothetical protein BBJ28_00014232 [Nothophytophthora sp. Chile5]|nr:hypothetical protein BBJ28_00014232 [Nothophytophthora sp. Chile5]
MSVPNQVTRTTVQVRTDVCLLRALPCRPPLRLRAHPPLAPLLLPLALVPWEVIALLLITEAYSLAYLSVHCSALCLRFPRVSFGIDVLQSKKGQAIKELVRREFEKGRNETDPDKIEALKSKYVRFNYLVLANSSKDQRLRDAMNKKQAPPSSDDPEQAEYRDL